MSNDVSGIAEATLEIVAAEIASSRAMLGYLADNGVPPHYWVRLQAALDQVEAAAGQAQRVLRESGLLF